ncbi:MAG: hypothetical protein Q8Q01_03680 [archaeon]|nr:hypothetical protein [archaeon]
MTFADWYEQQEKTTLAKVVSTYDLVIFDNAFGFPQKDFLDFNPRNPDYSLRKPLQKECRITEEQLDLIKESEDIYVTTRVFGEFLRLVEIVNDRTNYLQDVRASSFKKTRNDKDKRTKEFGKLKSFVDLMERVSELYQEMSEHLKECLIAPINFNFPHGRGSETDREIVSTAIANYLAEENESTAILTRDHDIMYLFLQYFRRQTYHQKENLNKRVHIHFVSREEPSEIVRVDPILYARGDCW